VKHPARLQFVIRMKWGAPKTNRTSDLPLRRGLLYPLSYRGSCNRRFAAARNGRRAV
jgi:hypothetical protein